MGSCVGFSSLLEDCGVRIGNIVVVYPKRHKLLVKSRIVDLTPTEFKLFLLLSNNLNEPVAAEEIYNELWNDSELKLTSFTLKTLISNLRRKIKLASDDTIKINHVKDKGYCLTIPEY